LIAAIGRKHQLNIEPRRRLAEHARLIAGGGGEEENVFQLNNSRLATNNSQLQLLTHLAPANELTTANW
jgi:hypothetical protein